MKHYLARSRKNTSGYVKSVHWPIGAKENGSTKEIVASAARALERLFA